MKPHLHGILLSFIITTVIGAGLLIFVLSRQAFAQSATCSVGTAPSYTVAQGGSIEIGGGGGAQQPSGGGSYGAERSVSWTATINGTLDNPSAAQFSGAVSPPGLTYSSSSFSAQASGVNSGNSTDLSGGGVNASLYLQGISPGTATLSFDFSYSDNAGVNCSVSTSTVITVTPAPTGTITVTSENAVLTSMPVNADWSAGFANGSVANPCSITSVPCEGTEQTYPNMPTGNYDLSPSLITSLATTTFVLHSVEQAPIAQKPAGNPFLSLLEGLFNVAKANVVCGSTVINGVTSPSSCPNNTQGLSIPDSGDTANFIILWDPVAAINVSPPALSLSAAPSSTASGQVTLTNSGAQGSTLNWTASSDKSWLTVQPASGCLNAGGEAVNGCPDTNGFQYITLTANSADLSVGTYPGTVTFNATSLPNTNAPHPTQQTVTVTSTVSSQNIPQPISVSVSPSSATVQPGGAQQFTATVTGTSNTAVTWSSTAGSVSANGLFTAPAVSTAVTVTATSLADTTKSGQANVTVTPAPATVTSVSVTCAPPTVQINGHSNCSAVVNGTNGPSQAVTWSASAGSISWSGNLKAPGTAQTVTVTATSQEDMTKSGSAAVNVNPVSVSIAPTSATVQPGATQQFTATVTGASDTTVTWSVNGVITGGTMPIGTVSSAGLYTAPATSQIVSVRATSNANSASFASAQVTVRPPLLVTSPPSCSFGASPQQIVPPEQSTLSWSCNNAVSCTLTGGTFNATPVSPTTGSEQVSPSTSTNYALSCQGTGSSVTNNTTVTTVVTVRGPAVYEINP